MKRLLKFVIVGLLLLPFLLGCAPAPEAVSFEAVQTSSAVQIPEAIVIALNGLAIALFTAGTVYLFEKFHLDLRQFAIPIAASFSTWVVTELQGYIDIIPEVHDPWLNLLFRILLALLPAAGILRLWSYQPATLLEHDARKN